MKASTKGNAKGKMHQVKGKIKEVAGNAVGNREMELEGKVENQEGKVQEKISEADKVLGK